ncbi:MAG: indolepyruvate oxidoreductase subunit beta [Bacillota bacterium]
MSFDLIVAGVGGQGSILLSHIIADAAIRGDSSVRVRVGETFGAAMRGGAVASHVRIGSDVFGPLVSRGSADVILALEPLEGLRVSVDFLRRGGMAILNTRPWYPVDVNIGNARYPELAEIRAGIESLGAAVYMLDATGLALEAGNAKAMNVAMLGALSATGRLPVGRDDIVATVQGRVPPKALDVNMKAFELGRAAMERLIEEAQAQASVSGTTAVGRGHPLRD